jgi:hypothetical protein
MHVQIELFVEMIDGFDHLALLIARLRHQEPLIPLLGDPFHNGRRTLKVVPASRVEVTDSVPLWARTI